MNQFWGDLRAKSAGVGLKITIKKSNSLKLGTNEFENLVLGRENLVNLFFFRGWRCLWSLLLVRVHVEVAFITNKTVA